MKKTKNDIIFIWDPVFKQNYYFICSSAERLNQTLKEQFGVKEDIEIDSHTTGRRIYIDKDDGTNIIVMWVRTWDHDFIAHEVWHAVHKCLRLRGVDDEETHAYCIGFVTKGIYKQKDSINVNQGGI